MQRTLEREKRRGVRANAGLVGWLVICDLSLVHHHHHHHLSSLRASPRRRTRVSGCTYIKPDKRSTATNTGGCLATCKHACGRVFHVSVGDRSTYVLTWSLVYLVCTANGVKQFQYVPLLAIGIQCDGKERTRGVTKCDIINQSISRSRGRPHAGYGGLKAVYSQPHDMYTTQQAYHPVS